MSIFQAVIFGIVEGITEFLPISSTGHLILTARTLGLFPPSEFLKTFEIAIQLGAILAVVVLYAKTMILDKEVLKRVLASFLPTAIIGFAFYKTIKTFLLGNDQVVLGALLLGGIGIIVLETFYKSKEPCIKEMKDLTYWQAVLIGVFQSIALLPGVSRSAATIMGGLALGVNRKTIVEFSFLLAIPTMVAATGLDLIKSASHFSQEEMFLLAVGLSVSFLVAIGSIKFLLYFIKRHDFVVFGIYRILIAVLFLMV